jgi:hypothetical protein
LIGEDIDFVTLFFIAGDSNISIDLCFLAYSAGLIAFIATGFGGLYDFIATGSTCLTLLASIATGGGEYDFIATGFG